MASFLSIALRLTTITKCAERGEILKTVEDEFGQAPPHVEPVFVRKKTEPPPVEEKVRFKLESAADLLAKPEPKLEWLIENIWVDKSRGLIAGNPGVGKTWLALDMLISVASGQPCLGKYPVKKGAVLLVEEEASEFNLSRRIHAMARARGLKDSDLSSLFHLTRQFAKMPADAVDLFHIILENDIRLVVFDSLRRFHGADENSSSEMQPVLDAFARLNASTEASVILIHHLAKSNDVSTKPLFERLRGSSDFWAWRDCLIGVEGEEESTLSTCSFQFRDAEAQAPIRVKRCVGALSGAIALEAVSMDESPEFLGKVDMAKSYLLTQFGEAFVTDIAKALSGRKSDNLKAVKLMVKQGILGPKSDGKVGVPE